MTLFYCFLNTEVQVTVRHHFSRWSTARSLGTDRRYYKNCPPSSRAESLRYEKNCQGRSPHMENFASLIYTSHIVSRFSSPSWLFYVFARRGSFVPPHPPQPFSFVAISSALFSFITDIHASLAEIFLARAFLSGKKMCHGSFAVNLFSFARLFASALYTLIMKICDRRISLGKWRLGMKIIYSNCRGRNFLNSDKCRLFQVLGVLCLGWKSSYVLR